MRNGNLQFHVRIHKQKNPPPNHSQFNTVELTGPWPYRPGARSFCPLLSLLWRMWNSPSCTLVLLSFGETSNNLKHHKGCLCFWIWFFRLINNSLTGGFTRCLTIQRALCLEKLCPFCVQLLFSFNSFMYHINFAPTRLL